MPTFCPHFVNLVAVKVPASSFRGKGQAGNFSGGKILKKVISFGHVVQQNALFCLVSLILVD